MTTQTTGVSFSTALQLMKSSHKVQRAGWNGKGMWICLGEGRRVPAEFMWNKHTKAFAMSQHGAFCEVLPYFIMKTADDKILMGWLASQTDMVADDWQVVEE